MSNKDKDQNSVKKIGLRYLEYSKQHADHLKLLASSDDPSESEDEKPVDYLAQMRKKR